MNPVFAAGCRVFQLAFRAALPFLPYRDPQLMHSVDEVAPLMKELSLTSVMLVTDPFLRSSGATSQLESSLVRAGINLTVYDRTCANPTVANVEEAYAMYKAGGCGALIAFGGGSSMDCAKAVGARVAYPNKTLVS